MDINSAEDFNRKRKRSDEDEDEDEVQLIQGELEKNEINRALSRRLREQVEYIDSIVRRIDEKDQYGFDSSDLKHTLQNELIKYNTLVLLIEQK
jgi:hypothetical protein